MGLAMIDCTEKIKDSYFFLIGNVFVFVLVIMSINPCMHHLPDIFWLDLIILFLLKFLLLVGKHSIQKK